MNPIAEAIKPTPTTEIEAVLDPLLDRLFTIFSDPYCVISRARWFGTQLEWRATVTDLTATGSTPAEAVANLIALRPKLIAQRRAKLQAELATLDAEPPQEATL